jgi:hypothetical protein
MAAAAPTSTAKSAKTLPKVDKSEKFALLPCCETVPGCEIALQFDMAGALSIRGKASSMTR